MFERFTDQSRRVVVLAQEEARHLNHNHIGTEHLLAGLRREDRGAAARALTSAGITLDVVRGRIEALGGRGQQAPSGHIPFTPRAKKCLELSFRAAQQLGHKYIGTGHLLLGLISMDDCVAVQVLGELGADLTQLRARVIMEIEDRPETPAGSPLPVPRPAPMSEMVQVLLDTVDERLSAIERHLGISRSVPDELRRYDEQITQVRREKEQAIENQDFHKAAMLRDKENELLAERARAAERLADTGESLGAAEGREGHERPDELARLNAEVSRLQAETDRLRADTDRLRADTDRLRADTDRLRALLQEHGIDPGGPGEAGAAAG